MYIKLNKQLSLKKKKKFNKQLTSLASFGSLSLTRNKELDLYELELHA